MHATESDATWDRQAAEARQTLERWRTAHPAATLNEIEQEVDHQLAHVRARLVAAIAVTHPEAEGPPRCPDCGVPMHWDGERTRHLTTTHDHTIHLTRRYARCPACGTGLFPPG